jgi:hypothetical protein
VPVSLVIVIGPVVEIKIVVDSGIQCRYQLLSNFFLPQTVRFDCFAKQIFQLSLQFESALIIGRFSKKIVNAAWISYWHLPGRSRHSGMFLAGIQGK